MCGIFGYTGRLEDPDLLSSMGQLLSHRGPDDVGYYTNSESGVHLGLRRLSIIDLAGGHQPVSNEDETIWIACNGEVYNYIELREGLEEKGHRFRTHSDVEVLVHLYEERGLDFLNDVNGMFGLVLFDLRETRLILARDRLGIKPIYYAWDGRRLVFASEIKPILLCPWVSRDPDWDALSSYLHLLYVPSPATCFSGIRKLESGTIAILEKSGMRFHSYWVLNSFLERSSNELMSFEDAADRLHGLLRDACRLQLRSDVPIGAFLSGGVDSSAVVALTNAESPLSMDTYTVSWENAPEKMDERVFARSVADMYGCSHHELSVSFDDFDRLLPLLVWHMEEPNADGAYVPTYAISLFARQRSKVILTGAGGDELFAGYGWYKPRSFSARVISQLMWPDLWRRHASVYADRAFRFPWATVFRPYRAGTSRGFVSEYRELPERDGLNAQMAIDLKYWLQDDILLLTDKMSMAASLEARVPLLDHRIVEFVLSLPSSYKLSGEDQKVLFKQAIGKYLPKEILLRRKDGFGAPIKSWMEGPLRKVSMDLLGRGELMRQGMIDERSLTSLQCLMRVQKSWGWALWILLNLELWLRFVREGTSSPDGVRLTEL